MGRRDPSPERTLLLRLRSYRLIRRSRWALSSFGFWPRLESPCSLLPVPAAHGSFPTLSPTVCSWMLDPLPRRYHRVLAPVTSTVSSAFPNGKWVGFPHLSRLKRLRAGGGFRGIAVGTQVTPRPPHRSVRAQLRHTAPTLGGNGKANAWPWMKDVGFREKVTGQPCHPRPREFVLLTAAPQRSQPEAHHIEAKGAECRKVGRHSVVRKVAPYDLRQPTPLFGDHLVHSPS